VTSDRLINILAAVTLIELMLSIGLSASVAQVWQAAREWRGLTRALVANYVLVPAIAFALVLWFNPGPMIGAGVMVIAACPGAPYAPPLTGLAGGRVELAVGWMVLLAGSSAAFGPLLLHFLLPLVTRGAPVSVDAVRTVTTLAVVQFLPLCVGMAVAAYGPPSVSRLKSHLTRLSLILNVLLIGVILVAQFRMLAAIRVSGYAGMLLLLVGSAAAGWLLGGRDAADRRTLAITTCVRNVGVALVIAGGSFPGTPAVTFATAYALFQTVATAAGVAAMRRRAVPLTGIAPTPPAGATAI
jgi:BASS family bile acid:Na+ symporter